MSSASIGAAQNRPLIDRVRHSRVALRHDRRWLVCTVSLGLTLIASLSWRAVFAGSIWVTAVASILAGSVVLLSTQRRDPIVQVLGVIAAVLLAAHLTVLRAWSIGRVGIPSAESLRLFADAFRNGWSRVLTSPVPMSFDVDRSAVLVLTLVCASSFAVWGALSSRWPLASFVGPFGVLASSRLLGATGDGRWIAQAVVFAFGVGVAAAVTSHPHSVANATKKLRDRDARSFTDSATRDRSWRLRRHQIPVVGALVALAVVVSAVGQTLSSRLQPVDPREVALPTDRARTVQPLTFLSLWAQQGDVQLFEITDTTSNNLLPGRWRLSVLDRFDGNTWLPGIELNDVGAVLPTPPSGAGIDTQRRSVRSTVTIRQLPAPWLPVPGWPMELRGLAISADVERGIVQRRRPDDTDTTYRVSARPMYATAPAGLLGLDTTASSGDRLVTPRLPSALADAARAIAGDAPSPYERALRLENYLRRVPRFDQNARSGHGYARLIGFIRGENDNDRLGTSEQFATAFAVLARSLGMPTRIVVGAVIPDDRRRDAAVVVTGSMMRAWPEVKFANAGWVPFDPTPSNKVNEADQADAFEENAGGDADSTPIVDTEPPSTAAPLPTDEDLRSSRQRLHPVVAAGLLLLAISAVAALVLRSLVVRQRHRRESGTPWHRIAGAWADADRTLMIARCAPLPGETLSEFHRRVASQPNATYADALADLAERCDAAVYGQGAVTDADANVAWQSADTLRTRLAATIPTRDKVRLALDPRR